MFAILLCFGDDWLTFDLLSFLHILGLFLYREKIGHGRILKKHLQIFIRLEGRFSRLGYIFFSIKNELFLQENDQNSSNVKSVPLL